MSRLLALFVLGTIASPLLAALDLEPIGGGSGWVGAGLLGAVLSWLLLVHLPAIDKRDEAKNKLFTDALEDKDKRAEAKYELLKKTLDGLVVAFRAEQAETRKQCEQERAECWRAHERYGEHLQRLDTQVALLRQGNGNRPA